MKKEENDSRLCELCKGRLVKKAVKITGKAKYNILECEKCKHTIARLIE